MKTTEECAASDTVTKKKFKPNMFEIIKYKQNVIEKNFKNTTCDFLYRIQTGPSLNCRNKIDRAQYCLFWHRV